MTLVTTRRMLQEAQEKGYAVGAFNITNMETVQAVIAAALEEKAPVIIQASESAIKYCGVDLISAMMKTAAKDVPIPVAVHLDHGHGFEVASDCVTRGFTSVMFDGSTLPFAENVKETQRVVKLAHRYGIPVEAELGPIVKAAEMPKDRKKLMTPPKEAAKFVIMTGCNSLGVSIGNAHGFYKGKPKLDFERLDEISRTVRVPLVLHGGSGIPDRDIKRAVNLGICKININTETRAVFSESLRKTVRSKRGEIKIRALLNPTRKAMKDLVAKKIRLFGSSGKA